MKKALLPTLLVAIPLSSQAATTDVKFGGFVKLDATYSQYSDGDIATGSLGREFYVPATVPVGAEDEGADFDMSVRGSRFNLSTETDVDGQKLKAFFEMDFYGGGGNEVVSNSAHPRLRHAFFNLGNLTFGQTWSTFLNVSALPESVDFLGPSEGTVFVRQPLIRYTMGGLQVAIENSQTFIDGAGATDDAGMPDLVARYNMDAGFGKFTVAAVARQLTYENANAVTDDNNNVVTPVIEETTSTGWGVSLSGVVPLADAATIKFMATHGSGIGRYVGLATIRDGALDADGEIENHKLTAAFASVQVPLADNLRTNLTYSTLNSDYENDNTGNVASANSIHLNLMYNPVKNVTYGVEFAQATRTLDDANDTDGSMQRVQFTSKYAF